MSDLLHLIGTKEVFRAAQDEYLVREGEANALLKRAVAARVVGDVDRWSALSQQYWVALEQQLDAGRRLDDTAHSVIIEHPLIKLMKERPE